MSKALLFSALVLSFVGVGSLTACGGDDSSSKVDLSTKTDLAKAPPDLVVVGTANCMTTLQCYNECTTNDCATACVDAASPTATNLFDAFETCMFGTQSDPTMAACPEIAQGMQIDMDNTACTYDPTTSMFIDANACDACQTAAYSQGGTCYSQAQACSADLN